MKIHLITEQNAAQLAKTVRRKRKAGLVCVGEPMKIGGAITQPMTIKTRPSRQ